MTANTLSAIRLRQLLAYDPEIGVFTRLVRTSNRTNVGDVVSGCLSNGYFLISVDSRLHKAHRLAWLWVHGTWPTVHIDHINGIKSDNRLCNLREATRSENMQNQRALRPNNKSSGLLGAYWHKSKRRWYARIELHGKQRHLGYFATAKLAHTAYLDAKRELHPMGML